MNNIIQSIFDLSLSCGYGPRWLPNKTGRSFREIIEYGDTQSPNRADLIITYADDRIIYVAPVFSLAKVTKTVRDCLNDYYMKSHMDRSKFIFYGVDEQSDRLCIRCDVFTFPDNEINQTNYIAVRTSIITVLDSLDDDLQNLIDKCLDEKEDDT
jgi:hypothetical protein